MYYYNESLHKIVAFANNDHVNRNNWHCWLRINTNKKWKVRHFVSYCGQRNSKSSKIVRTSLVTYGMHRINATRGVTQFLEFMATKSELSLSLILKRKRTTVWNSMEKEVYHGGRRERSNSEWDSNFMPSPFLSRAKPIFSFGERTPEEVFPFFSSCFLLKKGFPRGIMSKLFDCFLLPVYFVY